MVPRSKVALIVWAQVTKNYFLYKMQSRKFHVSLYFHCQQFYLRKQKKLDHKLMVDWRLNFPYHVYYNVLFQSMKIMSLEIH